jgi:hypothetical protein
MGLREWRREGWVRSGGGMAMCARCDIVKLDLSFSQVTVYACEKLSHVCVYCAVLRGRARRVLAVHGRGATRHLGYSRSSCITAV